LVAVGNKEVGRNGRSRERRPRAVFCAAANISHRRQVIGTTNMGL
jgi:hypothetical protein